MDLLNYIKSRKFQLTDSTEITSYDVVNESYNPFNVDFICDYIFNNGLIIKLSKTDSKYKVRVGKNNNTLFGLCWYENEEVFYIDDSSIKSLINGLKRHEGKQKYSLITGNGNLKDKIKIGLSLEEIDEYCNGLTYEKKNAHESFKGTFKEFYYYQNSLSKYDEKKILKVIAL